MQETRLNILRKGNEIIGKKMKKNTDTHTQIYMGLPRWR